MNLWKSITIRKKLTTSFLGLTALLGLTAVLATGFMLRRAQRKAMHNKGVSISKVLSVAVGPNVIWEEKAPSGATERALNLIKGDQDISLAAVVSVADRTPAVPFRVNFLEKAGLDPVALAGPLAATGQTRYDQAGYMVVCSPIDIQNSSIQKHYYLMLAMNSDSIERELRDSFLLMLALGMGMVAVGFAAAFLVSSSIIRPLEVIREGMRDISEGEGDLTARLEVHGVDEIAHRPVQAPGRMRTEQTDEAGPPESLFGKRRNRP
jgi:methyl-accepting chemotaxis protein